MSAPIRRRAGAGRIFAFALTIALAVTVLLVQLVRTPVLDAKDRTTPIEVEVAALGQGLFTSPELGPALQQIAAVTAEAEPTAVSQTVQIKRGGTLMNTLVAAGAERVQAHEAITALKEVFDPRRLRAGQEIVITMLPGQGDAAGRLLSVAIPVTPEREVAAVRDSEGQFVPGDVTHALDREPVRAVATINDSLFLAAERAGVPARIIMDAIRIFSWDVDFQRDIQPGDEFDVVFTRHSTVEGVAVRDGQILYAAMTLSGKHKALYRFEYARGRYGYFDKKGRSARKALLRTPVDGARLASRYGRRRHPILRYTRMHRGVDFAAARGTPIYAAGNGRVAFRGRNGAYGRYIRIRHKGGYSTAYAHLKRYARRLRSGSRVKQGQVIGYVGSSGLSTGPHLHFEVMKKGRRINPMRLRMPSQKILKGKKMAAFKKLRGATLRRIATITPPSVKVSRR